MNLIKNKCIEIEMFRQQIDILILLSPFKKDKYIPCI